jgi:hypothetical protein
MDAGMNKEEILKQAKRRFEVLEDANNHLKDSFIKSMKFSFNIEEGHWEEADLEARAKAKRPHITAHKLGKFVNQVVNAERGMPNRDLVIPANSEASINIARIYNHIINDIEYHSNYDEVTTIAGEYAVGGGFGYWRILTEYERDGLDQVIRIKPIINPLNVYLDEMDGFIREGMTYDRFNFKFPKFKGEYKDFASQNDSELWYESDKVFIAEWYTKESYDKTIAEVKVDGIKAIVDITDGDKGLEILRTRTFKDYKVKWYKLCGHGVLEENEWVGSDIPIIEVYGHKVSLEGKTYKKALTKDAEDMNRAYDYWLTSLTEKVALSPKAPYIVTDNQIKGYEHEWSRANVDNKPYLRVRQTASGIPQRTPAPEVGQGELLMLNITDQNIKDTLGMYESSIGMTSNERSGKAIQARAARSDLISYHFPDNLRRSRLKTKKQLIEIIPKVYNNERTVRLVGRKEAVELNKEIFDFDRGERVVINDLSVGKYDIRASNPMNPTIRQQAADNIREAMQYVPTHADILLPLMLEYTDLPGMNKAVQAIRQRTQQIQQMKQQEIQAKNAF